MNKEELENLFFQQIGITLEEAKKMIGKKLLAKQKIHREHLLNDMYLDFMNLKEFAKKIDMEKEFEDMVLLTMMKEETKNLKEKIDLEQIMSIPSPPDEKGDN